MTLRPSWSSDSFHNSTQIAEPARDGLWAEAWSRGIAYARSHAGDTEFVEEAVQEALLRAWRRRASLRDPEMFFPWLLTIVRNELSRVASKPRSECLDDHPDAASDEGWTSSVELQADVGRSVCRLSEAEQTVIRLRYEEDLTHRTIAERLDMPEGTIKVLLHRARGKLRGELQT